MYEKMKIILIQLSNEHSKYVYTSTLSGDKYIPRDVRRVRSRVRKETEGRLGIII